MLPKGWCYKDHPFIQRTSPGTHESEQGFHRFYPKHRSFEEATLDIDATVIATQKEDTLFSYKGYKDNYGSPPWR